MIIAPNAEPVKDMALLQTWNHPVNGSVRIAHIAINKAVLICRACGKRICVIVYWIRGDENDFTCKPEVPCCPKCPQWMCTPCCGGNTGSSGGGTCDCDCKGGGTHGDCIPVMDIIVGDKPQVCTPVTDIEVKLQPT